MNVALAKNNIIDNIIVVDAIEWAQENLPQYDEIFDTEVTPVGIGWKKVGGVWQAPVVPTPEPVLKSVLTPLEFLNRFTNDEVKTIMALAKTDPDVELWWLKYNKATYINLEDPQTIGGIQSLEAAGVIQPGRANQILAI